MSDLYSSILSMSLVTVTSTQFIPLLQAFVLLRLKLGSKRVIIQDNDAQRHMKAACRINKAWSFWSSPFKVWTLNPSNLLWTMLKIQVCERKKLFNFTKSTWKGVKYSARSLLKYCQFVVLNIKRKGLNPNSAFNCSWHSFTSTLMWWHELLYISVGAMNN